VPEMGRLGFLGPGTSEEYGGAGFGGVACGIVAQELEWVDSGIRSFASVQGSLVMQPIEEWGSEDQKAEWLPRLAAGRAVGCFGLTEPDFGSNPAGMRTHCQKDGSDWLLSGQKMWITNGSFADVALVWAKDEAGAVHGFLVDTTLDGFQAPVQGKKWSLRCSETSELLLDQVRVPDAARLPLVQSMKGPLSCLTQARYGIAWGAIGAAKACYEEALSYSISRKIFERPLASFQLTQEKLADMAARITQAQLLCWRLGRLKEQGTWTPEQVSLAKRQNVRMALDIARSARTLLAANGITLEYHSGRHACNLETVLTYEGTEEIHTLILGQALTGIQAFQPEA
ncbi:MAG: acyl-CoA dehydrogenase family protein, partial [Planctomycetes bacterium]|nr:acyl-CoA dehydrogenase family protein [Planctomycetota bacterium]